MFCAWRKTNSMAHYNAVFVSAAFIAITWPNVSLENKCAAEKLFLDDLYRYMDCRNTLSYLPQVFPPTAGIRHELRSLVLTSSAVPCSYTLNLGWSIYMFACLLSTPTASNIAKLTALSFSQLRPLHFPLHPPTHTYAPPARKTNMFLSYCICKTKEENLPSPNPKHILTSDSQVLGQLSWQKLTSVLPFDTRHKWKTRQTRFPHKESDFWSDL